MWSFLVSRLDMSSQVWADLLISIERPQIIIECGEQKAVHIE
jgi:hypothetical protein